MLIDPDNWLLEDISQFVPKVKRGQAYAQVGPLCCSPVTGRTGMAEVRLSPQLALFNSQYYSMPQAVQSIWFTVPSAHCG